MGCYHRAAGLVALEDVRPLTDLVEVKRTGWIIKLLTVQKILDEEHVQKL